MRKITSKEFQDLYKVHVLKPTDCVENFSCGDEDLDYFLKYEALLFDRAMLALTYVVIEKAAFLRISVWRLTSWSLPTSTATVNSIAFVSADSSMKNACAAILL